MKKNYFIAIASLLTLAMQAQKIEFTAPEAYPEGIAYDAKAKTYYVSSARLGTIGKVSPEGIYKEIYTSPDLKSSYGLKLHPDGKRLFVCISDANHSKFSSLDTYRVMARLISIDLQTGKKSTDVDLSKLIPGKHFANDIAFDGAGNAYVTDSYANAVYKVEGNKASVFCKSTLFVTQGTGLNGIVWSPDGYLIVASSGKGSLFKIDMKNPEAVEKIKVDQFFPGADGLAWQGKELVLVQNGGVNKIFKLSSQDGWKTAKPVAATLSSALFAFPSTAAVDGDKVWIMNAKFHELTEKNNVPSKDFKIQQAVFKSL